MLIEIKRTKGKMSIEVLGHTKTEICNGISCLLWSLVCYAENTEGVKYEYDFQKGESFIEVESEKKDVFDFMELAFRQIAENDKNVKLKVR